MRDGFERETEDFLLRVITRQDAALRELLTFGDTSWKAREIIECALEGGEQAKECQVRRDEGESTTSSHAPATPDLLPKEGE